MTAICVIGIGSAHGADCAGWAAIEALRNRGLAARFPPGQVVLRQCGVPAQLYDEVVACRCRCVILLDAVASASPALQWLPTSALRERSGQISVHGVGVGDMLALIDSLAEAPPQIRVLALGVDAAGGEAAVTRYLRLHLSTLSGCLQRAIAEWFAAGLPDAEKCVETQDNG